MLRRTLIIPGPVFGGHLTSTDGIAVLHGGQTELTFDEELLFYAGSIEVDPRVIGASGELRASIGKLHAKCGVKVGVPDAGPRIEIEIARKPAGKFRAVVTKKDNGTVLITILAEHPVLRRYLGPPPELPFLDTPLAKSVLAEIIATECARMVVERKHPSAVDLDAAAFYSEHRHYLDKYLLRCHKMMSDSDVSTIVPRN